MIIIFVFKMFRKHWLFGTILIWVAKSDEISVNRHFRGDIFTFQGSVWISFEFQLINFQLPKMSKTFGVMRT